MSRHWKIAPLIVLPILIAIVGIGLEKTWVQSLPDARAVRLLALPADRMTLATPLWDYRATLNPDWQVTDLAQGMRAFAWEGPLDTDPEAPGLAVETQGRELQRLSESEWESGQGEGFRIEPGRQSLVLGTYFFSSDHEQIFGATSEWDSPILEWEELALGEGESILTLNLALEDAASHQVIWSSSVEVDSVDWSVHRVRAEGVPPGAYILRLASKGAFSSPDKTVQRQIFLRRFTLRSPTRVDVRLESGQDPPRLRYRPKDPVSALLADPAAEPAAPIESPWETYDESSRLVRPIDIDDTIRSALFLPTPSEWSVQTDITAPMDLVFFPVVRNPQDADSYGDARLLVEISRDGKVYTSQRVNVFSQSDRRPQDWTSGVRVPIDIDSPGPIKLTFLSQPVSENGNGLPAPPQPLFLGEPILVPRIGASKHPDQHARPDVVLISIDTLRADAVSVIGGGETTPFLDKYFGTGGVVFTQLEAPCTWTLPSHASLFLSQYMARHGVRMHYDSIAAEAVLPAERFALQGYETAAFVDREFLNARFGFHQGFFQYEQKGGHFAGILPRCETFLANRDRSIPLFLFLHTYDVHDPYDPPEPFRSKFLAEVTQPEDTDLTRAERHNIPLLEANRGERTLSETDADYLKRLYLAEVAYVDHLLEGFMGRGEREGWLKDPLVILTSDHGESFREHGTWLHGWTLYEEETRVPLLVRLPGGEHAGRRIDTRASLVDIPPTLFDLLGWKGEPTWQGVSFAAAIRDPAAPEPVRDVIAELDQSPRALAALFRKARKTIETRERIDPYKSLEEAVRLEAYDLESDPGEKTNLAGAQGEDAAKTAVELKQSIAAMTAERKAEGFSASVDLDPENIESLQREGYLQGASQKAADPTNSPSTPSASPTLP